MQITRKEIPFVKMSGTGNDFILIDHRRQIIVPDFMSEFARLVCRRKFSVGADGLIFVENSEKVDFKWRFFNGDGSVAEMCGNGARCAARFAYMQGIAPANMRFETLAGIIEAKVSSDQVSVKMTSPKDIQLHRQVDVDQEMVELHSLDTGVPHAVIFVDGWDRVDVKKIGRKIRYHEAFMPAGTNVNFVSKKADNIYHVRTYERGVEDETFACGTGAVASALIASLLDDAASPVEIMTSGGDTLTILFDKGGDAKKLDKVFLRGPANLIYKGELSGEALIAGRQEPGSRIQQL